MSPSTIVTHPSSYLLKPTYLPTYFPHPQVINSDSESLERSELVGLFSLYGLYRHLCPANIMPDAKLYKRLWSVQKEVPVVVLHSRTVWFPPEFLLKYAAFEVKKLEPLDVEGMYGW